MNTNNLTSGVKRQQLAAYTCLKVPFLCFTLVAQCLKNFSDVIDIR